MIEKGNENCSMLLILKFVFNCLFCYSVSMRFKYQTSLIWLLLICFAWLQLLSPLLHAHSSEEAKQSGLGVHFHIDFLPSEADTLPTLKNINAHGDVIGMEESIIRDTSDNTFIAIFFLLFLLPFILRHCQIQLNIFKLFIPLNPRNTSLKPRAPPYF